MNATGPLHRRLGTGSTLGSGIHPRERRHPFLRWLLPVLMLGRVTLAAPAQYPFRTEVSADGTVSVFQGPSCPAGALTIPDTLDARLVTRLGASAFEGCTGLTSVTIPDSVTTIESWAFGDCTYLTNVIIGRSVTNISMEMVWMYRPAFGGCTRLLKFTVDERNPVYTSVDGVMFNKSQSMLLQFPFGRTGSYRIPDGVTGIGQFAFHGCTGLTSIMVPDSVTSIGANAFRDCTRLTNATIGNGVIMIGMSALSGCTGLTTVTIGNSVTSIGDWAFNGCANLDVTIGAGFSGTWRGAFERCSNLSITIGDGVKSIGVGAFYGLTGLTRIALPDTVTSIGDQAFAGCTNLTRITIPGSITNLANGVFLGCTSLASVNFEGNAPGISWSPFHQTTAILHYLPGTKGWTGTFGERPTDLWVRPNPTILDFGDGFGLSTNGFGFVISWATNVPVVVEASVDLGASRWAPISTNTLTDGWVRFNDPEWKSHPARVYRVLGQ